MFSPSIVPPMLEGRLVSLGSTSHIRHKYSFSSPPSTDNLTVDVDPVLHLGRIIL
jgi:hypothetical protein